MALVLLPVAITIASLSVPALWARHCSQSESRVFYANAGHVTSFWDAVQTCSRLNGFLAEFPTPADDTTLTYVNKTAVAPYEPLVVGAVSFGSTSVFRWYTSGEIVEKIGDVDSAMNVSRSAGTEGEKKCFFLMGGRLGRDVCEGWEPQLVHALCQINLHEKKFLTGACTLCMCPGMSRPQCRKTVCGWPCAELIETTTCEYYPCRSNKTWDPPSCLKRCECPGGCDPVYGQCRGGCSDGWTSAPGGRNSCNVPTLPKGSSNQSAKTPPAPGQASCACKGDLPCSPSGVCWACWAGAGGKDCSHSDCPPRRYGPACLKTCHCKEAVPCAQLDGQCLGEPHQGCLGKWLGRSCTETKCSNGLFGPDCRSMCACKHGEQCDLDTGHCAAGCEDGWTGVSCNITSCPPGQYGTNCWETCQGCWFEEPCNKITGRCLHTHVQKRMVCDEPGMYGRECDKSCKIYPSGLCTGCDRDHGDRCGECKYGYHLNVVGLCEECPDNMFGFRCQEDCDVSCPEQKGCNKFTSECNDHCPFILQTCAAKCSRPCDPGTFCDLQNTRRCRRCPRRTFGANCAENCSAACGPGNDCDPFTGKCLFQCYDEDQVVSRYIVMWDYPLSVAFFGAVLLLLYFTANKKKSMCCSTTTEQEEEEYVEEEEVERGEAKTSTSDNSTKPSAGLTSAAITESSVDGSDQRTVDGSVLGQII